MKRTLNILMTTLLILTGCQDKPSLDPVPGPSETYPIQFGISADLEVESKATLIEGDTFDENGSLVKKGNYEDFGFIALGGLTVEPGKYSVFEANTVVSHGTHGWTYSPIRFWQPGSYVFAGVMPSPSTEAESSYKYTASIDENNHNKITLTFGGNGFDLASNPHDLMIAFTPKEVEKVSEATDVLLNFSHQLALVNIEVQTGSDPMDIVVNSIKIYGNHKIATAATFANSDNGTTIAAEWTLGSKTTDTDCYHQVANANKIENLLVFPEYGSAKLSVALTYTESYGSSSFSKTKYGTIDINWQAGKIYTYKTVLTSESIVFGVPTVTDWANAGKADDIPEM
jgi:hypothetical protein